MKTRIWTVIALLGLMGLSLLLYWNVRQVDLGISERMIAAEEERHAFVISHDFDELKSKLIEVHRDYWTDKSKFEQRARNESIVLGIVWIFLAVLLVRMIRTRATKLRDVAR